MIRTVKHPLAIGPVFLACYLALVSLTQAADETEPLLSLEAGGPTSYVTALAFSPDEKTLYASSWDKTVRVWRLAEGGSTYQLDPAAWRVPIGPGLDGAINAMALSSDGNWLAVGGKAVVRGAADFRSPGRIVPTLGGMSEAMRLDEGTIYVFDTRTRETYTLRGHRGEVRALKFVTGESEQPVLVSAAREWHETEARFIGAMRVWNVRANEPEIISRTLPEPKRDAWPKIATRRIGKYVSDIEVAIAWGDGIFRLWNVATNRSSESPAQGQFDDSVIHDNVSNQFYSGSLSDQGATRLRAWKVGPTGELALQTTGTWEFQRQADAIIAPRALATASSTFGGAADTLVSVMHRHYLREPQKDQYELWLLAGKTIKTLRLFEAGPPPRRVPVITAVPGGKRIAVSHGAEVHVHEIANVKAGINQPQVLRSLGLNSFSVQFVRQDDPAIGSLGVLLRDTSRNAVHDIVFNLQESTFAKPTELTNWRTAASTNGDWRLVPEVPANNKTTSGQNLRLMLAEKQQASILLKPGREVTAFAFAMHLKTPLLALATHREGSPELSLYHAHTGRQLRQLSAHTGLIRSLSFSADGSLLASAADDQAVCIWRMVSLDRIVDRHGMAPGISVRQEEAGLIANVDETQSELHLLKTGDRLLGRVIEDKIIAWPTTQAFYDAFWEATPGEIMQVRCVRANKNIDLKIPVMQGIDERKPLASLFFTRPFETGQRNWIAWSPLGPYQSSDEAIEKHLGWHFNTGRAESPVAFAEAGQYREKYFRRNLLASLIATGEAPPAEIKALNPNLNLILVNAEVETNGDLLIRQGASKVDLLVTEMDREQIAKIDLLLDGQPLPSPIDQADRQTWTSTVDAARWSRGNHRLKATLLSTNGDRFVAERRVRFQPLAPQIHLTSPQTENGAFTTKEKETRIVATITPDSPGEAMVVELRRYKDQESNVVKKWESNQLLAIDESMPLEKTGNTFELVARNRAATKNYEPLETSRKQIVIHFSEQVVPEIINALVLTEANVHPVTVDPSLAPTIVTVDKIQFSGAIKNAAGKIEILSSTGEKAELDLTDLKLDKPTQFRTTDLALKPGEQRFILRNMTGNVSVDTPLRVEFRPPLPEIVFEQPAGNMELIAGVDEPTIPLRAKLLGPTKLEPFNATLLINGEPVTVVPTIDLQARTFSAQIPLKPGTNEIELHVQNQWNKPRMQTVSQVRYLQLPTISFEKPRVDGPFAAVQVAGRSASPLKQVEINGVVVSGKEIVYDNASGQWQASLAKVLLKSEPTIITASAWNQDGKSLVSTVELPAFETREPPPNITIYAAADGSVVSTSAYEMRFSVRSKSPLNAVQLLHNQHPITYKPPLADLKPNAAGWYVLDAKVAILLDEGVNQLTVLAVSNAGSQTDKVAINYIVPPPLLNIEQLETLESNPTVVKVHPQGNMLRVDQTVPSAKVWVTGRLRWPKTSSADLFNKPHRLQIWVNGFQQTPVDIEPVAKNTDATSFRAFVVLNRKQNNRIQISLPDLPLDASATTELYVDCEKPVVEQRLHVLVVGVGQPAGSEKSLEALTLEALQIRTLGREARTNAFDRVAIYGPLVGSDITPQQIRHQLALIKIKIDELYAANRSSQRPANDVVMIYLQGGSLANADGDVAEDFFITTRPASDPRTSRALRDKDRRIFSEVALRSNTLADLLTHTTGAHVIFLDVHGEKGIDELAQWPSRSHAAMLRFTWLKDSLAPPNARLYSALPAALRSAGELREVDSKLDTYYQQVSLDYPQSLHYRRWLPKMLQNLVIGELAMDQPVSK